jgi:hypothetical protein
MKDSEAMQVLELIAKMIAWEQIGTRTPDTSPSAFAIDDDEQVIWTVRSEIGGPVRIVRPLRMGRRLTVDEMIKAARDLIKTAHEVDDYMGERHANEQLFKRTVKSLLRRKSAAGIRLVELVSEPIHVDRYENIGVEITFQIDREDGAELRTVICNDVDELVDMFAEEPGDLGRC